MCSSAPCRRRSRRRRLNFMTVNSRRASAISTNGSITASPVRHLVNVYDFNTATSKPVNLDTFDFNVSTVFADVAWRKQNWIFTARL